MPTEQLDKDVVNLSKAIRQTESGGNFQARGKSGEFGAYQYTAPTWATYSKKFGVNAPLEQATPEQQNEVTYRQIKEWKDQGYKPGQIASMWNSGKPDAYLDKEYKGTNKFGVTYDVPKYAESVAKAYQTIKNGGNVGIDPKNPSSVQAPQPEQPVSSGEAPKEGYSVGGFLKNVVKSGGELIGGIGHAIAHPIETGKNLGKAAIGAAELLIPGEQGYEENARAIGKFFADRYGGAENIKNSLYNDPVGVLLDLSTLLTGGGTLAAKAGQIGKVAEFANIPGKAAKAAEIARYSQAGGFGKLAQAGTIAGKVGRTIDPLNAAVKAGGGLVKLGGKTAAGAVGITTGTGGEAVQSIYKAGREGGDMLKQTTDALRGRTSAEEVLQNAQAALTDIKNMRSESYLKDFNKIIKPSAAALPFDSIIKNLSKQLESFGVKVTGEGLDFSRSTLGDRAAQNVVREIYEDVSKWDDFSPQGLDTLKRRLDSYYSPSNDARAMAMSTKSSVRDVLKKNIPGYEKMTKGYEEASEALKEAQSAVGGPRMTQESALRRIRSIFRDAQKERLSSVTKLEEKTGRNIKGQVAGLVSNQLMPGGLAKYVASGVAGAGLMAGSLPAVSPSLLLTSPRVMAETARALGITARKLDSLVDIIERTTKLSRQEIMQLIAQSERVTSGSPQ